VAIPRIIHQTWKSRSVPEPFRAYQKKWQELHPSYEYRLWTDEDNSILVRTEFPELFDLYRSFRREIFRTDLVRCLYLARFGGVYVDLDVEPLRPLDGFLRDNGDCILGAEPEAHARRRRGKARMACNAVMASIAAHPFWALMTEEMQRRASVSHADPVSVTGPIALDAVYEQHGQRLGVTVSHPDAFFPLPDLAAQSLPLSRHQRKHFERMLELKQYPAASWGVHHWAHTWIPENRMNRLLQSTIAVGREAAAVLRAQKTIDEVIRSDRYGVHFPEQAFAPRTERASPYREAVVNGGQRANESSMLFLVLLHNRLDLALLLRARLESLSRAFRRARVLVLFDDSTDGTERVMADFREAQPGFVRSVPAPQFSPGISGFGRMARLRNTLLEAAEQEPDTDLVAILDGDLEGPVSHEGLLHSVELLMAPGGPDAVAAFGVNNWGGISRLLPFIGYSYYDPIAFRETAWERDLSDAGIRRRLGRLRRGDPPLTVKSAFGGLAVYRATSLRGLRYDESANDCEHVSLHRALAARGGKLVVNPSLLLLAGRQGHHQQLERA